MNLHLQNAETIFGQAIEIESPDQRSAYLDEACQANPVLRREIEKLVANHFRAGDFLVKPALETPSTQDQGPVAIPGTMIGPYKLLEVIGEGGMGTVYMAKQTEPVQRRVALKLIKTGMDSRQVIARFEAERQALAMMDHPNIAKVLDAGTTKTGRPYFLMELVKGKSITEFCDEQQLDLDSRLKLFQQACHAVQHAHQKGIIHRDIKPSNVLVAMYDDKPVPKVIDFGVAKATGEELTEHTMFTRFGQIVGTLEYMSPEQAQFNQLDIDTRSDIYSLGALLYELLSGQPPFAQEQLISQALDETLRMIREDEPTKPSTNVNSAPQPAQVASNRKTSPEKLASILRGDLDWIVMKSLEKDRSRRYQTAIDLATDVQRFLQDETVVACPPSATYRFRKFARRHKWSIAFMATVVSLLILGITGTVWQAIRATQYAEASSAEAEQAKRQTRIAQAIERFWNEEILQQADPFYQNQSVGRDTTINEIFDRVAVKLDSKLSNEDPLVAAAIYKVVSTGYYNLGEFEKAREFAAREIPLREAQLGIDDSTAIDARSRLGLFLLDVDLVRATDVLKREMRRSRQVLSEDDIATLNTMNRLARALASAGQYSEAARVLKEALDLERKKFGESHYRVGYTLAILGRLYSELAQYEKAKSALGESLRIGTQSGESTHSFITVIANHELGHLHLRRQNYANAEPVLRKAWIMGKRRLGTGHVRTKTAGKDLARCLSKMRRLEDEQLVLEELTGEYPDDTDLKISLAGSLCNSGILSNVNGRSEDSIDNCDRAIEILDDVLESDKDNVQALNFRTNAEYTLAMAYFETGDFNLSTASFEQAIADLESREGTNPDDMGRAAFLGQMHKYCGESYEKLEELDMAVEHYTRANQVWSRVASKRGLAALGAADGSADHPDGWMLGELLDWLISAQMRLGLASEALEIMDQKANLPGTTLHPHRELLRELVRAYVQAKDGDYRSAVQIADKYCLEPSENVVDAPPVVWIWAASAYAAATMASQKDTQINDEQRVALTGQYGERAVEVLRSILANDDFSSSKARQELLNDEEFSVLNSRDDFQKLIRESSDRVRRSYKSDNPDH